jgi:carbon-monoxide dehydrogenase medium subunit
MAHVSGAGQLFNTKNRFMKGDCIVKLPQFEYCEPTTIEEACNLLLKYGDGARVFAGGTDLLVKMKHRQVVPRYLVSIKKIPNLDYIRYDGAILRIGGLATVQSIKESLPVRQRFQALNQAAGLLSTPQVRNLATIGGNLCNASPAADTAPALIASEAKVTITGKGGTRTVAVEDFFVGPGMSVLQPGEILTEIQIANLPRGTGGVYLKHGKRLSDIAVVGVGVVITLDGEVCKDIKIALASVAPIPMRAKNAEKVLKGQTVTGELIKKASLMALEEARPIDDYRAYAEHRRGMTGVLVEEAIGHAIKQIKLGGS